MSKINLFKLEVLFRSFQDVIYFLSRIQVQIVCNNCFQEPGVQNKARPKVLIHCRKISYVCLKLTVYCIFSITIQYPYAPCPPALTTLLSMSMSSFSFLFSPSTSSPPLVIILLSVYESVPIFLVVQFVHQIPNVNEIIWYLSFSDWLISLSIMFSRSIHTVTNGVIAF